MLQIDRGFADDLRAGRTAALQVILDGTDSNTAGIVLGYVNTITAQFSQQSSLDRFSRAAGAAGRRDKSTCSTRAWFNENLESRNYFVPGVIVIVVSLVSLLLTSMAVVREKEIGTMEQIMVTPITATEFILGKTLPFALIGLVDVTIVAADRHLLVRGAAARQHCPAVPRHQPVPDDHAGHRAAHLRPSARRSSRP